MSDDPTHLIHDGTREQAENNNIITTMTCAPNITQVAGWACRNAKNLIRIDLPEGITIIGMQSFLGCISLKEIKFPKSLTSIGRWSFDSCSCLEQVDLLQTNVLELGRKAFFNCTSLREMTIPDSLQTFGYDVFYHCSKLVPSTIDVQDNINEDDVTTEVVAFLRSIQ